MEKISSLFKYAAIMAGVSILVAVYVTSPYHGFPFHSLVEMFGIIVACGIFMVAWNSRQFQDNGYFLFLGIAYLFVAILDLLHTRTYQAVVFQGYGHNLSAQLRLAARYVESASLFSACFFIGKKKLKIEYLFFGYTITVFLLLGSIFFLNILPACFIEGAGLTLFNTISESIICLILLASIALLEQKRKEFDQGVLHLLVASIIMTIGSELAFTFLPYNSTLSNLIGHSLQTISFYLIYKAIVETGLMKPYQLLFRNLKQREEMMKKQTYALVERIRELNCLYGISHLVEKHIISLDEILQRTVALIPTAWQYPKVACARIMIRDQEFKTKNFRETPWKQTSDIFVDGDRIGSLAVCYLEKKPENGDGPFLREERRLINAITEQVGEIIQHKQAEAATKRAHAELDQIFNSADGGMCVIDKEYTVLRINDILCTLLGTSKNEATGKKCHEILHDSLCETASCPLTRILGGEKRIECYPSIKVRDGRSVPCILTATTFLDPDGHLIGIVENFKDITERKKVEEELQKAQKLESLGILAGGIAHDFNNLLAVIIGNLNLMEFYAESEHNKVDMIEVIEEAKKAYNQAKQLTLQLLTFSRGGAPNKKTVSLADLLQEATSLALRGSNVRCELCIPEDLWWAEVDEGQVSQAIDNLIINADQAMPEGGTIRVCAENVMVRLKDGLPLKGGNYIKVSVRDQGIGIPEKYLSRIFDPFFSTKEKGSGLGLAICYSIIKRHKGHITVESQEGVETTFYIYLPALEKKIFTAKKIAEERLPSMSGNILFMDDQQSIRNMAEKMLTRLGYQVQFAWDGTEAIDLYKKALESGHCFDAVILDLTVPGGMGGKESIRKLLEIDPEIKAIVSSGYSNDPIMSEYRKYGFRGAVAKPYEMKDLDATLQKVIYGETVKR